ncbi:DUF805 domain-containing protein [Sagittula stellata]|uniref:DUF805 domain-containing protein n=1 Tax=Sagittula stellata (strain ATCC 700073 / DSM 11524 / E-37) TaxID=388399 RepID=A3K3U4_SAGS3|nr:DUF805 domain-containing protein [Sagittula stellata]EBA08208.1 hypothetical protein SSE37_11709 [Sagittula stellata E-37]
MTGPFKAIGRFFTRALDFGGRATRAEFWWVQLAYVAQAAGLVAVIATDTVPLALLFDPATGAPGMVMQIYGLVMTALLVPGLTLCMRRLHDTGRSGWWYFILIVPLIGPFWFIFLMLLPSDDMNRYGSNPHDGPDRPLREAASGGANPMPAGKARGAKGPKKSTAWDSAHVILQVDAAPSPAMQQARKAEISDYYRRNILKEIPAE